jgi:hypothetical protein
MFARTFRRFHQLLKAVRGASQPGKAVRYRLGIENLETRLAPACSHTHLFGQVSYTCDGANDSVLIDANGTHQRVTANGVPGPHGSDAHKLYLPVRFHAGRLG